MKLPLPSKRDIIIIQNFDEVGVRGRDGEVRANRLRRLGQIRESWERSCFCPINTDCSGRRLAGRGRGRAKGGRGGGRGWEISLK